MVCLLYRAGSARLFRHYACFYTYALWVLASSVFETYGVLAYSPEPSAQAPLMKLPKTLGLSIALLAHTMIAAQEPQMQRAVPPL